MALTSTPIDIDTYADFSMTITVYQDANKTTPFDITGYTIEGKIRDVGDNSFIPGNEISFTGTVEDGPAGKAKLTLTDVETATLNITDKVSNKTNVLPKWDVIMTSGDVAAIKTKIGKGIARFWETQTRP